MLSESLDPSGPLEVVHNGIIPCLKILQVLPLRQMPFFIETYIRYIFYISVLTRYHTFEKLNNAIYCLTFL